MFGSHNGSNTREGVLRASAKAVDNLLAGLDPRMTPVAVVTGAAGGIGSVTCDVLEAHGWDVVAMDRHPSTRPGALQVDLADAPAVAAPSQTLPQVDALVNNAALQLYKPLLDTTVEEWDAVAAVNLRAPFLCLKAWLRSSSRPVARWSTSRPSTPTATSRSIAAYAATKGGLAAFTRAAALELAPHGVRVNAVAPGAVDTPALRAGLAGSPGRRAVAARARTPAQRIGQPHEIAEAIAFLLDGERSGFITGQSVVVDGGALARLSTE